MRNISRNLHMIDNLAKDAKWHKENCGEPHCGVSLFMLREAAAFIYLHVSEEEREEAQKIVESMPIV